MANITIITEREDGKFDVSLTLADGRERQIEGLDKWHYALEWSHMYLSFPNGFR